ncbi:MAG TPA: hypothetical protein PK698_06550 [Bacilli bacterium]|nr:hypothetical protein [Bacilli bacterium]
MPQATMYNPNTGHRVAVESGSQQAQGLFGQGYFLETSYNPVTGQSTYNNTPATPPAPPTPTTPPAPTIAESAGISGVDIPDYNEDPTSSSLGERYRQGSLQQVDPEAIRKSTRANYQALIDSINNLYSQKLSEAKIQGQGRLGQTRAIGARSGILGSDFQATNMTNMEGYNRDIENTITAEQMAKISAIESQINKDVSDEIKAQREAITGNAEKYLTYLSTSEERKQKQASNLANLLLSKQMVPGELSPEQREKIQKQYGMSFIDFASLFETLKGEKEKNDLDLLKTKSETLKLKAEAGKIEKGENDWTTDYKNYQLAGGDKTGKTFDQWLTDDANRKAKALSGGLDSVTASRVDRIANQFDNEQIVKDYNQLTGAINFIKSIPDNTKNPADNQGLIYAFAKAMDPNSVVREGEYATVQKYAQSWAEAFGLNAMRVVNNQEFLTEEAVKNIKQTILRKYNAVAPQYTSLANEYGRRINRITGLTDGIDYISNYSSGYSDENGGGTPVKDFNYYKQRYPNATDQEINALLQKYGSTSFKSGDGGTPTAMRTDRHNNPIAVAVKANGRNEFTNALDSVGIAWGYGDAFPGNPQMVTIDIKGDPLEASRVILAKTGAIQNWYKNHTGKAILSKYGVYNNEQFAKLPINSQKDIIRGIYNAEGNQGLLNNYLS